MKLSGNKSVDADEAKKMIDYMTKDHDDEDDGFEKTTKASDDGKGSDGGIQLVIKKRPAGSQNPEEQSEGEDPDDVGSQQSKKTKREKTPEEVLQNKLLKLMGQAEKALVSANK
eukprot:13032342-Alexandrium_andersonii.AAC.1